MTVGTVYLLHFASPVNGKRHYVGFTQNLVRRLNEHGGGILGCNMTRAAVKKGVRVLLGNKWENVAPEHELKLKTEKNLKRHCSSCNGAPSIVVCDGNNGNAGLVPPEARLVPRNAG